MLVRIHAENTEIQLITAEKTVAAVYRAKDVEMSLDIAQITSTASELLQTLVDTMDQNPQPETEQPPEHEEPQNKQLTDLLGYIQDKIVKCSGHPTHDGPLLGKIYREIERYLYPRH